MWGLIIRGILRALQAAGSTGVRVAKHGRVAIIGLIGNRPLGHLTHQEIRAAFAKIGLREAHNGHFVSRLIERGPQMGIRTLNDLARLLNSGVARAGSRGTTEIVLPGGRAAVVVNQAGELVTLLFL